MTHRFLQKLALQIHNKKTYCCVGLDPDLDKIPSIFPKTTEGITVFLKAVIDATQDYCVAYKPNISFFESLGIEGLKALEKVMAYIPSSIPSILDAKRGDIGNTSKMQAKFVFDYFGADATTLHPYMGKDSIQPFLDYKDKFSFLLGITSNPGAFDFETQILADGTSLYEKIIKTSQAWALETQNLGYVVGATKTQLVELREKFPSSLFLIPGVGSQGGDYETAIKYGPTKDQKLALINASRSILYAQPKNNESFSQAVQNAAKALAF